VVGALGGKLESYVHVSKGFSGALNRAVLSSAHTQKPTSNKKKCALWWSNARRLSRTSSHHQA